MARARFVTPPELDRLPESAGIYLLTHIETGDTYIGSSYNVRRRVRSHLYSFSRNRCQSEKFRILADRHGLRFRFKLIEVTRESCRRVVERGWIRRLQPTLNNALPSTRFEKIRPRKICLGIKFPLSLLARMMRFSEQHELRPTLSQIAEAAVREYLDRREQSADAKRSAKR